MAPATQTFADNPRTPAAPAPRAARSVLGALVALSLAATLVFAGLLACMAPPTTRVLARATSLDDVSPYTRAELVDLAVATRDYTVGSHEGDELLRAQAQALAAAIEDGRVGLGALGPSPAELRAASPHRLMTVFAGLPQELVLDASAVAHLDDCYAVISLAVRVLGANVLAGALLALACGRVCGTRSCGGALVAAGAAVLLAFALLGGWALADFDGFFGVFHSLFFAQGTWKFPWDSLLICMYPDAFWYGMAAVWVATSCLLSAACVAGGLALRRGARG